MFNAKMPVVLIFDDGTPQTLIILHRNMGCVMFCVMTEGSLNKKIQFGNLAYSNPRFVETPDSSNQKLFPLDTLRADFYPRFFGNPDISSQVSVWKAFKKIASVISD